MRCPQCDATENRVVDTRSSRGGRAVRRRRQCTVCDARFTTYEYVEERPIQVLKRSGAVEDFDRSKLVASVKVACAKRPVSAVADQREIRDVAQVDIAMDRARELTLLFDPEHALDDRITMEQFIA